MFTGVSFIYAYMTDSEVTKNIVTIGNVDIQLTEPNYPGNNSDLVKMQQPNQETPKDPTIVSTATATDSNDVVVFLKMTVPVVNNVTVVSNTGALTDPKPQEVYWFKTTNDAGTEWQNSFNTDWIELETYERNNGSTQTAGTRTYVFGYKYKLEGTNATDGTPRTGTSRIQTSALFNKVQLKNLLEGTIASGTTESIKLQAFGIQADTLIDASGNAINPDKATGFTKDELVYIYGAYANQNGVTNNN